MVKLYLIGGTMGVGKTETCRILKNKTSKSVFLDGDWCWDMNPFTVTEETKKMVVENICFLLNNFIKCSEFESVYFCWVMHEQAIIDNIIDRLNTRGVEVCKVSLICREDALRDRLQRDVDRGIRKIDVIERSVARIKMYDKLKTHKIDVSDITAAQAADKILAL